MSGVNKVILVGRLGKDPEVKSLENGAQVANFSIATSEVWKDKTTGEKKESTEWHNIVLWRGLAEIAAKYLKKGSQVYIEGKLRTRKWEKGGVDRYTTEIVGDNLTMLGDGHKSNLGVDSGSGNQHSGSGSSSGQEQYKASAGSNVTDDLPF